MKGDTSSLDYGLCNLLLRGRLYIDPREENTQVMARFLPISGLGLRVGNLGFKGKYAYRV